VKVLPTLLVSAAIAATVVSSSGADVTKLTLSLSESSPYSFVSGTTLYYAPTGTNSGSFTVTATAKADTDIQDVDFPAAFGTDELTDSAEPYSQTYSWTASSTDSGSKTVTATETGGVNAKDAQFTVTPDKTGPTGQSVALSGGPGYPSLSVPLLFENGTDAGAGVDESSGIVERASATLANTACGTFGTFAPVTLSGNVDTTVQSGNCYRYQYKIADQVGNVSAASSPSSDAKVDSTPPSAPFLTAGGLTNAALVGSVIYTRAIGAGSFTISATATDAESGIASYAFPSLDGVGFVAIGVGSSRTYSFSGGQLASAPVGVTAINGTGLTSPATTFSVATDPAPPRVVIQCNGQPCHPGPYPKSIRVTLLAVDTGGSGAGAIRYTFDGSSPTLDHGADYEGPFVVKTRTRLKVRAYDKVGNVSTLATTTIRSLADRLVFVAPSLLKLTAGARSLLARVSSSHHATATATMSGPKLKTPRRWRFVLGAGASLVQFKLPELATSGRYTIVWTVRAGTRTTTRTTRVILSRKG
jgi:hypothetical protein